MILVVVPRRVVAQDDGGVSARCPGGQRRRCSHCTWGNHGEDVGLGSVGGHGVELRLDVQDVGV